MTTEQKARAYDEALKLARDYYKANLMLYKADENVVLEDIFPELKESEDEKIRKGITKSILDLNTDWLELRGVTKEDALAWLEKQGEQKPKWTEEDDANVHCCIAKAERDIANGYVGRNKELIDWLKSLKQRMEK